MRARLWGPWLWGPAIFVTDLLSKRIVLAHESELRARVEIVGEFLRFTYVRNPGAAMGLLPAGRAVLVTVSIVASALLVWLYLRTPAALRVRRAALAAVVGGALGNLVDRIFYGGLVVDFIDIGIGGHRFYTFNVADMGVSIGGAILFLSLLRQGAEPVPAAPAAEAPAPDAAEGAPDRTGEP